MPTGWRPFDVQEKYPLRKIDDPYSQIKYKTNNSFGQLTWIWIQFGIAYLLISHLFLILEDSITQMNYMYSIFIFIHIFSFTAMLDNKYYSIIADLIKVFFGVYIIYSQNFSWYGLGEIFTILFITYFIISLFTTSYFYNRSLAK